MSRIGKKPVAIPSGVTIKQDNGFVTVKGPKGELRTEVNPAINVAIEGNELVVTRPNDLAAMRAAHGAGKERGPELPAAATLVPPALRPGEALLAEGRALAKDWKVGRNLFLDAAGVASEAEYKRRVAASGRISLA